MLLEDTLALTMFAVCVGGVACQRSSYNGMAEEVKSEEDSVQDRQEAEPRMITDDKEDSLLG